MTIQEREDNFSDYSQATDLQETVLNFSSNLLDNHQVPYGSKPNKEESKLEEKKQANIEPQHNTHYNSVPKCCVDFSDFYNRKEHLNKVSNPFKKNKSSLEQKSSQPIQEIEEEFPVEADKEVVEEY